LVFTLEDKKIDENVFGLIIKRKIQFKVLSFKSFFKKKEEVIFLPCFYFQKNGIPPFDEDVIQMMDKRKTYFWNWSILSPKQQKRIMNLRILENQKKNNLKIEIVFTLSPEEKYLSIQFQIKNMHFTNTWSRRMEISMLPMFEDSMSSSREITDTEHINFRLGKKDDLIFKKTTSDLTNDQILLSGDHRYEKIHERETKLILFYYDFESHSANAVPCTVALYTDQGYQDKILDVIIGFCEDNFSNDLACGDLIYCVNEKSVFTLHSRKPFEHDFLIEYWFPLLWFIWNTIYDCVIDEFRENTIEKWLPVQIVCVAHNGSRYDLPLQLQRFWNFLIQQNLPNEHLKKMSYIQAGGRITGYDFNIYEFLKISYRDSLLYTPTPARSLRGAAIGLKVPIGKIDLYYLYMDVYLDLLRDTNSLQTRWRDNVNVYNYIVVKMAKDHHKCCFTCSTEYENWSELIFKDVECFDSHLNKTAFSKEQWSWINECDTLLDMENYMIEYCANDVWVVKLIFDKVIHEMYLPNLGWPQGKIGVLFKCYSQSGIAAEEVIYMALQNQLTLAIPTGEVNRFIRYSVIGGRCQSSVYASPGYTSQWLPCDWKNFDKNQMESLILNKLKITKWEDLFHYSKPCDLSPDELIQFNLFEKCGAICDVCSEYPTALVAPLPCGEITSLSHDQILGLNEIFHQVALERQEILRRIGVHKEYHREYRWFLPKNKKDLKFDYNPYKYTPFIAKCRVSFPKDVYQAFYDDCRLHRFILYSIFATRSRLSKMNASYGTGMFHDDMKFLKIPYAIRNKNEFASLSPDSLIWTWGQDFFCILTCVDVANLLDQGWSVRIVNDPVKTCPKIAYGVQFNKWDEHVTSDFYEKQFQFKKDSDAAGKKTETFFAKTMLNSSYGFPLNDPGIRTSYHFSQTKEILKGHDHYSRFYVPIGKEKPPKDEEYEDIHGDGIVGVDRSDDDNWHVVVQNNINRTLAGIPPENPNNKLPQLGSFCLSVSRHILMTAMQASMGSINDDDEPFTPALAYCDTDSVFIDFHHLKQWEDHEKWFGSQQRKDIGKNTGMWPHEKFRESIFGFVIESVKGDNCEYWMNKHKINLPCFGQLFCFAKKNYYIHCVMCEKLKSRSKGQDTQNPILNSLTPQQLWLIQSFHWVRSYEQIQKICQNHDFLEPYFEKFRENECLLFGNIKLPNCLFKDKTSWNIENHWMNVCSDCFENSDQKYFATTRTTLKIQLMSSTIATQDKLAFQINSAYLSRKLRQVPDHSANCCQKCGLWRMDYVDYPHHIKLLQDLYE